MTAPLQLFDALPAHIEDALRASIQRFGVLVPVVKDQHGRIVDGHHRSRIAREIGVSYVTQTVTVADDDEAREIAHTLNADRRQLTEEQRREVVADLRRAGHSERAIAGALGVSQKTVNRDIRRVIESGDSIQPDRVIRQGGGSYPATRLEPQPDTGPEPEVADALPLGQEYADEVVRRIDRQVAERVEPVWPADELELRKRLEAGETVVVSFRPHHTNIVRWAQGQNLLERIDRRSEWGNPFELPADGDRDTVIRNYAEHYLPHKPSLLGRIGELRGRALACWCAPEPCHGDVLKARAEA